jgi:hypothetical protein
MSFFINRAGEDIRSQLLGKREMKNFRPPHAKTPAGFNCRLQKPAGSGSFLAMENKKLLIGLGVVVVIWILLMVLKVIDPIWAM